MTGGPAAAVWLVIGVVLALSIACGILVPEEPAMPTWALVVFTLMAASLGVMGALIVTRQPSNAVGWILWLAAVATAVSTAASAYANHAVATDNAHSPGTVFVAWLSQIGFFPAIVGIIIFIPLLFPDGRFLGRRWRWAGAFGVAVIGAIVAGEMFAPGPISSYPTIANPVGLAAFGSLGPVIAFANGPAVILAAAGLGIMSSVLRYRKGSPIERAQLRWFAATVVLTLAMLVLSVILGSEPIGQLAWLGGIISLSLIPIAIGVAILRYRLYEIDRIISRTIGWAIVTGLLVGVFAGLVVALQAVLAPVTNESTLAVAASTLVAFALFQPLRRRVQQAVDRRFDRARYDGERIVDAFAARLRDLVELETVSDDLQATVSRSVNPAGTSLWLRESGS
jgi:hypothetical protein